MVILAVAIARPSFALTQIDFASDPGDYIGAGRSFSLMPADGAITATRSGAGVSIHFSGVPPVSPKTFWDLTFVPIEGTPLLSGNYPSGQRWPFQSPKRPGLDVSGDGRGCNTLTGRFTVHEASFDSGGNVEALAIDAEQHCEGFPAALRTRIRINSSVPMMLSSPQAIPGLPQEVYERTLVTLDGSQSYDPDGAITSWRWSQVSGPSVLLESPASAMTQFRAPVVAPGGADVVLRLDVRDGSGTQASGTVSVHIFDRHDRRTWLTWQSPPGDYIGQGQSLKFSLADGDAVFAGQNPLPIALVNFQGGAFNSWNVAFAAPNGASLALGQYANAERFPFQSAGHPGLSVDGSGRVCNTLSGQFTLLEIDGTTSPEQFGARFVQSCEGFMPALRGTVLFNAIAPGDPVARITGPTSATAGLNVDLDGTGSSSTGSALLTYQWRQLSGPAVTLSDPTLPQVNFVMPATTTSGVRFELEVTDEDGLVDAAEFAVTNAQVTAIDVPTLSRGGYMLLASTIVLLGALALRRPRAVC